MSQNDDHHGRLVWAKAPGVICLLLPCHHEVNQDGMSDENNNLHPIRQFPSYGTTKM